MDSPASVPLNPGVEVVAGPAGFRLKGPALAVVETLQRLRMLNDKPEGYKTTIGEWTLLVSDYVAESLPERTLSMPGHAWNVAASVLSDVAYGEYENPFDFGDVGYLDPRPDPDLGVEIVGELIG